MKNKKIRVSSICDKKLITQETLTIQKHIVQKKYLVLADNKMALCPGYFNRKTNFILGEKNSILGFDKNFEELDNSSTSKLFESDGYFIYPIPCYTMKTNKFVNLQFDGMIHQINLTSELGFKTGQILAGLKITHDPILKKFFETIIDINKGIGLNKSFLLNSNPLFAINVLLGYYKQNKVNSFYINASTNLYAITNIFHYVGASYSLTKVENGRFKVYFKLPFSFKNSFPDRFIRKEQYFKTSVPLAEDINAGIALAVPFNSCVLEEVQTDEILYDLTCERHDATNYSIPMSPILKNSDGDILAASGIFTKEALKDAEKFSPSNKEYYKNLNDGKIEQWIADDAILGLYNATNLKK